MERTEVLADSEVGIDMEGTIEGATRREATVRIGPLIEVDGTKESIKTTKKSGQRFQKSMSARTSPGWLRNGISDPDGLLLKLWGVCVLETVRIKLGVISPSKCTIRNDMSLGIGVWELYIDIFRSVCSNKYF